ncbi:uncharacterized protein LOC134231336 [Saccostrea cucullata]|uniref:uncharacterized protein LOC134231336 n=1 Tax=Saccostrea cuccullata TaxID=36930 RepID=UPI002ED526FD
MDSNCNYPIGSSCTIYATNTWLGGNPCSGCTKSLVWYYSCRTIWSGWGSWSSCPGDCSTQSIVRYRSCVRPGGGCGTAPSQSMGCLTYGCTSSSEISRSTPNDYTYYALSTSCFLALGRTSFTFRAKANNDLHLMLNTHDNSSSGSYYEFIIAGWSNTKSVLRIDGTQCDEHLELLLSQSWYDTFWISWSGTTIRMGTGTTVGSSVKLSCTHSPRHDVKYIWIKTAWGSSGQWRFPNDVSCTHELNSNVNVPTSATGCNGVSTYACNSGYKQVAGNTQRTCYGKFWTGYPLVCSVSTCKIDILFIIEASSYTSSIYSELVSVIGDLVRTMQISTSNVQVGVISYDNAIDQNFKFNVYTTASSLDTAITALTIPSASTTTNLAEALRVAFYDFVKLSNGNRFQAYKYFVIVGKSSPTHPCADIGLNIRQVAKNQVFGIGISPTTTLANDLKSAAGSTVRYVQATSPADLATQFNTVLTKIAVCPTSAFPGPTSVACKLDIVFIVENFNLRFIKRFVAELVEDLPISSTGVRVGFVVFDNGARTEFGLAAHTSSEAVKRTIEGISETSSSYHYVDKGLIHARDNVFTVAGGDRADAVNYYVFIVGPYYSEPITTARIIRSSRDNIIFGVHIGTSYATTYKETVGSCGDYSKYTNINFYNNLINIKNTVKGQLTTCYQPPVYTQACKLDIAFIIDDTIAVTATHFMEMKTALEVFVSKMLIGDNAIRIGIVTFGDGATTAFPLNQYSNASDLISAINALTQGNPTYNRNHRYVEKAITFTTLSFFTQGNGDRDDSMNYYVVLTYGGTSGSNFTEYGRAVLHNSSMDIFILGVNVPPSDEADYQGGVISGRYMGATSFATHQCDNNVFLTITQCTRPADTTTTDTTSATTTSTDRTATTTDTAATPISTTDTSTLTNDISTTTGTSTSNSITSAGETAASAITSVNGTFDEQTQSSNVNINTIVIIVVVIVSLVIVTAVSVLVYKRFISLKNKECVTLQQGYSLHRSCHSGYYLEITSGIWRCKYSWYCSSSLSVNHRMNSQCNYGTSCTIWATSSWLGGDPCSGCLKTLVWYDTCKSNWGLWGPWSSCPFDCFSQNVIRNKTCVKPNGGCGSSPSISTSCLRIGCTSSTEISITTPGENTYLSLTPKCFVAIGRTSFIFRARANRDLYLALTSSDCVNCGSQYEIHLGGQNNTISKIKIGIDGTDCASLRRVILSQIYFYTFWVSWTGSVLRVGTGNTVNRNIFMSCSQSTPYDIKYVMIRTGLGSSGEWRFPNDIACTQETTKNVKVITDNSSCHGVSHYACASPYIPIDGNTQRTCGPGKVWSGHPLTCSENESATVNTIFVVIASVIPGLAICFIAIYYMCRGLKGVKNEVIQKGERAIPPSCNDYDEIEGPYEVNNYENFPTGQDGFDMRPVYQNSQLEDNEDANEYMYHEISSEGASVAAISNPGITEYDNFYLNLSEES